MPPIPNGTEGPLRGTTRVGRLGLGGAEGTRTPDFLHAMQALFQLSYSPECHHQSDHSCCGITVASR